MRAAREQDGELDQLITDLLDLARYYESAPHRETVRLDLLTDEAVRRVRQRAPHQVIDTQLHPCLVHVDPSAVDHAVSNLVDNALKWTPSDAAVRVVVENGQVSVTDFGPGIAEEPPYLLRGRRTTVTVLTGVRWCRYGSLPPAVVMAWGVLPPAPLVREPLMGTCG